jgi:alpha-glucosidase
VLSVGVAGIWNDMDEPSVFDVPSGTMPLDVVFDNEGEPATGRQMHNLFGQLMSRSTFEGLSRLRPDERAFVLTRSSFAGGQRYAAVWTGDATADWSSLRQSVSMLLGLGVSGFPFVGSDIGGFVRMPSAELCTRWLQVGVFSPFMRMHTENATPDKEPWSFGWRYEAVNKAAIELRYQLLPYIYSVMQQASESGLPAMRPLFMDFPNDERTAKLDDEFLFGDDLLVAPVLYEGIDGRDVYLPAGEWFDYWTGKKSAGNATVQVAVTIDSIPLFVRAGGFIFRQPVVQHTGEMPGQPLRVLVAPSSSSRGLCYEDDGKSLAYRQGEFMKRAFRQTRDVQSCVIDVEAPTGTYRPAKRDLVLETWLDREPTSVAVQAGGAAAGENLPKFKPAELAQAPRGWTFTDGKVTIKAGDRFEAARFTIQF